jgi:hypothetical protein
MDDDTAHGDGTASTAGHRLWNRVKQEIRKLLVIVGYLWVLFSLLALHEMLIRRDLGLAYAAEGLAILNALVLGKVMLIAENLHLGRGHRGQPMIYPILRQAFLFSLLFIGVHFLEQAVTGLFVGSDRASGATGIGGGGLLDLLTLSAILFVASIPYFGFRALALALGWPALRELLFVGSDRLASITLATTPGAAMRSGKMPAGWLISTQPGDRAPG